MIPLPESLPSAVNQSLFRGVLNESDQVTLPLSAASLQASRLASRNNGSFVFSTRSDVFTITCSPTRKRTRPFDDTALSTHEQVDQPHATESTDADVVLEAVADDYIVPRPFSFTTVQRFMPHCTHQSEVQSVVADDTRVATVDMYGRCIVTIEKPSSATAVQTSLEQDDAMSSFVVPPSSLSGGEPGWAGVALKQNDPTAFAVARQHFRDVTLYDGDVPVQTIHSVLAPGAVSFCGESNMIAVAEGSGLSFYDFRAGEQGSCIGRKAAGSGQLLAMDVSSNGEMLAVAGMDRTVHVFDIRTLTIRDRWPACLKYECAAVLLSRDMAGMAYVCSVDNEVACGAWSGAIAKQIKSNGGGSESLMISGANTKSPRRAFGFRGDVRLTGMARRNADGEEIAAISEAGAFYLLRRKRE